MQKLNEIPCPGIREFPDYLYRNPHQGDLLAIGPELLGHFKENRAESIQFWTAAQLRNVEEEQVRTEFDWIRAMKKLENLVKEEGPLFMQTFAFEQFQELARDLDRSLHHQPQGLRKGIVKWDLIDFKSINEICLVSFLTFCTPDFWEQSTPRHKPYLPILFEMPLVDAILKDKKYIVPTDVLKIVLHRFQKGELATPYDRHFDHMKPNIDFDYVANIPKVPKEELPTEFVQEGIECIDFSAWMKKRNIFFPPDEKLQDLFDKTLEVLKHQTLHPVLKACRVWYDCMEKHYFYGAHKRTGRALASAILLAHGYLPSRIDGLGKSYNQLLIGCLKKKNGFSDFLDFVVENMIKTHGKYMSEQVDESSSLRISGSAV